MINESYQNIGGFTVEHLKLVLSQIKGETTSIAFKGEF